MKRCLGILPILLLAPLMLSAEKKPEFPPLSSCSDGPIDEKSKKGEGVKPPHILQSVDPEYTKEARKMGIQGTVVVEVVLTPQGKVCPVRIVKGLTFELDQNAAKAVEKWKFKPAERDGQPVAAKVDVEVAFRLY